MQRCCACSCWAIGFNFFTRSLSASTVTSAIVLLSGDRRGAARGRHRDVGLPCTATRPLFRLHSLRAASLALIPWMDGWMDG